jgi:CMP-N,N'-diacetyllegionaminic acid synthase
MPKILTTICARGGSKGVPGKNMRPLLGKPLVAYSIETARACPELQPVIVSTDSPTVAEIARQYGAQTPFMRPEALARDQSGKWGVLQHALQFMEAQEHCQYDWIVDLDPTSPLRSVDDVRRCMDTALRTDADAVITVCRSHKNPYFNMVEEKDGLVRLSKEPSAYALRRQDAPAVYSMNASIYVIKRATVLEQEWLFGGTKNIRMVEMPEERSVDIDREIDFQFVELLLAQQRERKEAV